MITIAKTKTALMNTNKIVVRDGSKYFYTTAFCDVQNSLGVVKATLKEYTIYKAGESEIIIARLYKTTNGNWYDLQTETSIDALLATTLKMAIDESEKSEANIEPSL